MLAFDTSHHGSHCACKVLAAAVACDHSAISFRFCRDFLMKRWIVECNHGCQKLPPIEKKSEHWHDVGPIDPVKAILVKNDT